MLPRTKRALRLDSVFIHGYGITWMRKMWYPGFPIGYQCVGHPISKLESHGIDFVPTIIHFFLMPNVNRDVIEY